VQRNVNAQHEQHATKCSKNAVDFLTDGFNICRAIILSTKAVTAQSTQNNSELQLRYREDRKSEGEQNGKQTLSACTV
jgi:hypothetical protein